MLRCVWIEKMQSDVLSDKALYVGPESLRQTGKLRV